MYKEGHRTLEQNLIKEEKFRSLAKKHLDKEI